MNLMKCLVHWIPLRIRVRSRNTQPHLKRNSRQVHAVVYSIVLTILPSYHYSTRNAYSLMLRLLHCPFLWCLPLLQVNHSMDCEIWNDASPLYMCGLGLCRVLCASYNSDWPCQTDKWLSWSLLVEWYIYPLRTKIDISLQIDDGW